MTRRYFLADVSGLLSRLAAASDWETYFQLLAMCETPETPEAYDPRKRQRIPRVVDVKGEG